MTTHRDQSPALVAAEQLAAQVLGQLGPGCSGSRVLTGNTKRGPAFVYACAHCATLSVISVPAGGLRDWHAGDATSRTRIATFWLPSVILETGAFIESDGAIRALFAVHLPGRPEPEWEITTDSAEAVGEAVRRLRELTGRNHP